MSEETRRCRLITCAHMRSVACYNRGYGGQVSFVSEVRNSVWPSKKFEDSYEGGEGDHDSLLGH